MTFGLFCLDARSELISAQVSHVPFPKQIGSGAISAVSLKLDRKTTLCSVLLKKSWFSVVSYEQSRYPRSLETVFTVLYSKG